MFPYAQPSTEQPIREGQSVEIRYEPSHSGDPITIPGTVVRVDPPYCYIDTPNQKNQKVHRKHLSPL
ncbi:hypothetical protein GCM10027291_06190 [Telluribacter humicola]|uniref:PilZ domain-containing protein n=1 Tax=Telluribacter humicola TaxID=1720261 RepID=UPI001A96D6A2|nr:PilZ domain-containing protein [Telluribacter humicola]